ncbi:MAG: hypothetical protein IJX63_08625 [Lachnospiraceae bacterium]|nr:hypothetical protein [Lachnospiraceae bacterium]
MREEFFVKILILLTEIVDKIEQDLNNLEEKIRNKKYRKGRNVDMKIMILLPFYAKKCRNYDKNSKN